MLDRVSGIIEGRRWLAERLRHLEDALKGDLTPERRKAIEAEIATLMKVQVGTVKSTLHRALSKLRQEVEG